MLSIAQNEAMTRVGRGSPMGELMRRYWHPIAATSELDDNPTKRVRILGEDLVLYKDRSGTLGLIDLLCPHRRVDMSYGIPEEHGLRCMYHGWMFDETGQCTEQPFEETVHPDGRFKEKVRISSYPVEALAGMVFAYLGPQPAPLLPNWE
jgi:5,5'-dehydrodivanillate O-demethylase